MDAEGARLGLLHTNHNDIERTQNPLQEFGVRPCVAQHEASAMYPKQCGAVCFLVPTLVDVNAHGCLVDPYISLEIVMSFATERSGTLVRFCNAETVDVWR